MGRGGYHMLLSILIKIFIIGFGGLLLGAVLGKWAYTYYQHHLEALYLFCGGMLIGVIGFELVPESIQLFNFWSLLAGFSLSFILFNYMESAFHSMFKHKSYLSLIAFVFAILAHNVPVGIALGMSGSNEAFGMALLLALFIHHLPEGIALYILTRISTLNEMVVVLAACIVSLVLSFSAGIGMYTAPTKDWNGIFMGIAIGSLCYVAFHEMIGKVLGRIVKRELFFFVTLGILVLYLYLQLSHEFL